MSDHLSDDQLREAAKWVIAETVGTRDAKWQGEYGYRNHHVARRLLELLPPAGGTPAGIRDDAEHVAKCDDLWAHGASESDLFEAVRRGQRVAAALLKENPADDVASPIETGRFKALLSELTECVKPNDNADGEWSAMPVGDGTGWYLLGPRYASRSSRTVVGLIFLDSFPGESPARDERVAVSIAGIINEARRLCDIPGVKLKGGA